MTIPFHRLDHLQITIPPGEEPAAKAFYIDLLGLTEIEKPDYMKPRGGFWVAVADIQLHIGVETPGPASKRHPAFEIGEWEAAKAFFREQGVRLREDPPIPHFNRFSIWDPFGNRMELLQRINA